MLRAALILALVLALAACATTAAPTTSREPAARLPSFVVATPDTVLVAPGHPKVRVAFPRSRLPLHVDGVRDDGVLTRVEGPVEAWGLAPIGSLGVVVCDPGPVGDGFYAGAGNVLRLRSAVTDGRVRVHGTATVRVKAPAKDVPWRDQFRNVSFDADVDVSRLCTAPPPRRNVLYGAGEPDPADFPKGTAIVDVDKNTAVTLLDAPGGKEVLTLPATEWGFSVVRLAQKDGFDLVAAGGGPYVTGWMRPLPPRAPVEGGLGGLLGSMGKRGPEPWALDRRELLKLPLVTLAAGTTLQQFGVARATLHKDGWARVVRAEGAASFVIAAVDDDVTVEGWVQTAALGDAIPPR